VRDAPLRLWRYFRRERPDAVHAVMWPVTIPAIFAYRMARLRGPLMVNDQIAYTKSIARPGMLRTVALTTRLFYRAADYRVLCSKGAAEAMSKLSGIPLDRFEVIYNPIEPPAEIPADPEIERLWDGASKRIIAVGSLKPQKNHALLLDAFARLPDKSARLMILGEGPLRGALTEQAAALGISDRVVMPGFALDPWPYYASADLFVLSSDFEGFANVITEAMWAGLNVVCTDCESGPREILADGRFGTLVPVGDADALGRAIAEALEAPPRAEEMRARALEISGAGSVERYSELLLG
jgi:glycosyltransferase involved in cell wall biosynthesis